MNSIIDIEQEIVTSTDESMRKIEGLWSVDCLYAPINNGRAFNYKFLLAQTARLGCAYSTKLDYSASELETYLGKDLLNIPSDDNALKVALLDSVYPLCSSVVPTLTETMEGSSETKLNWRSKLILNEAQQLLGTVREKNIVNVGVVGNIITTFLNNGANIVGTDFDSKIAGKKLFGHVDIYHGDETIKKIASSDLCIVTGMTITTATIDDIILCCRENNVKIIVFAETGANLGGYYVRHGVDAYIGEPFPFYTFCGISRINVFRA